jgi:hypothetical protein
MSLLRHACLANERGKYILFAVARNNSKKAAQFATKKVDAEEG